MKREREIKVAVAVAAPVAVRVGANCRVNLELVLLSERDFTDVCCSAIVMFSHVGYQQCFIFFLSFSTVIPNNEPHVEIVPVKPDTAIIFKMKSFLDRVAGNVRRLG